MNNTLMRQWTMLRAIPRHPRRIDALTIHAHLTALGMMVSLRTVQRDLNALAQAFPLDFDESKPQGWCWRNGASQLEVPSMDAHAALTFNLVEQYIQNLLPRSTLSHMAPWFNAAQGVANSQASSVTKWQEKLRVIPHSFNRIPPQINPEIQATIYSGLMTEKQLEVTYRALSTGTAGKTYPLHPLGLVVMEQVVYLVCTVKNYQDARFLAMHRIDAARLLEDDARRPQNFDMDVFISKEFGIRMGEVPLYLSMRVRGILSKYLAETPVGKDQVMTPMDDEWTQINVTVPDTVQLRMWLRSMGPDAVVVSPAFLKEQMVVEYEQLQRLYAE